MENGKSFYRALFTLLLSVVCSIHSLAQLQEFDPSKTEWTTVGEIKWLANTKASLKYFLGKTDTTYLLSMQDEQKLKNSRGMNVVQNFSISFNGIDNTTGKLYDALISFFKPENRKDKKLEKIFRLGNERVHVQHYPKLLSAAIMLSTSKNHIVFTEKELKKLFNR